MIFCLDDLLHFSREDVQWTDSRMLSPLLSGPSQRYARHTGETLGGGRRKDLC